MEIDRRRIRRLIDKSRTRERLLDHTIRDLSWLDPVANVVQKAVGVFYSALGAPGRSIKNLMHGTTVLGHPLHPALVLGELGTDERTVKGWLGWWSGSLARCLGEPGGDGRAVKGVLVSSPEAPHHVGCEGGVWGGSGGLARSWVNFRKIDGL